MRRKKKRSPDARDPRLDLESGDPFVDWTFRRLQILLAKRSKVYKVKNLRDPADRRKIFRGYTSFHYTSKWEIYLNGKTPKNWPKVPLEKVLIHELAHGLYDGSIPESSIIGIENIIWKRFTEGQIRFFKKNTPRHFVKKQPKV